MWSVCGVGVARRGTHDPTDGAGEEAETEMEAEADSRRK